MPLFFTVFIASILVFFVPGSAHAYVGPGLGLGAIGRRQSADDPFRPEGRTGQRKLMMSGLRTDN